MLLLQPLFSIRKSEAILSTATISSQHSRLLYHFDQVFRGCHASPKVFILNNVQIAPRRFHQAASRWNVSGYQNLAATSAQSHGSLLSAPIQVSPSSGYQNSAATSAQSRGSLRRVENPALRAELSEPQLTQTAEDNTAVPPTSEAEEELFFNVDVYDDCDIPLDILSGLLGYSSPFMSPPIDVSIPIDDEALFRYLAWSPKKIRTKRSGINEDLGRPLRRCGKRYERTLEIDNTALGSLASLSRPVSDSELVRAQTDAWRSGHPEARSDPDVESGLAGAGAVVLHPSFRPASPRATQGGSRLSIEQCGAADEPWRILPDLHGDCQNSMTIPFRIGEESGDGGDIGGFRELLRAEM
ncbi:hypothetical protein B0H10DRAFT_1957328 [Mycena sp. CBHHK59/15]|nr:hypothetical protein B0H10DRAFT_1957328 [Mycena sp. CBHHK59/15]